MIRTIAAIIENIDLESLKKVQRETNLPIVELEKTINKKLGAFAYEI